ncbi:amidohydrolase [Candidatus Poribacteria bacterium]|nr:amidohydrolase [Candidatus Poribacteria bacterium]
MSDRSLMHRLRTDADLLRDEAVRMRRDFHAHPELGFEEHRTSQVVARYLEALGLEVERNVGKTGVVGLLRGSRPGRTVLVRADMDALPITEETRAPYTSTNPGVMHACGHDGHTTIGLMTARVLAGVRDSLAGTVKFAFQPAEEILGGAKAMIADGVLTKPEVDAAFGLHLWSGSPTGSVATKAGPIMAAADTLSATVSGKGGHAAMPHYATDTVVAASQFVTAVQSIVSRSINPMDAAAISFCMIHGGTAVNVLPETVALQGTMRTFREPVRALLKQRLHEVAQGVASTTRTSIEVAFDPVCDPTENDEDIAAIVTETATELFGESQILTTDGVMGSEDISFFLREVPGCYFFIGAGDPNNPYHPHHNPRFDFNEDVLTLGTALMASAVARYLNEGGSSRRR